MTVLSAFFLFPQSQHPSPGNVNYTALIIGTSVKAARRVLLTELQFNYTRGTDDNFSGPFPIFQMDQQSWIIEETYRPDLSKMGLTLFKLIADART